MEIVAHQPILSSKTRGHKKGRGKVVYRVKTRSEIQEETVETILETPTVIPEDHFSPIFKGKKGNIKWRKKEKIVTAAESSVPVDTLGKVAMEEEIKGTDEAIRKMQHKLRKKHLPGPFSKKGALGSQVKDKHAIGLLTTNALLVGTETDALITEYINSNMKVVQKSLTSLETFAKDIYTRLQAPKSQQAQLKDTLNRLKWAFSWNKKFSKLSYSLKVFGSAANGFWTSSSDVDLTLIVRGRITENQVKYLKFAQNAINEGYLGKCQIIRGAKVPILKFVDSHNGLKCDLSVNGALPLKNSELLAAYAEYDGRFKIIGFFVKEWAKANQILGGNQHMLSSYAYLNMVIHYLQTVQPPVLPCLQTLSLSSEGEKEEWIEYPVRAKNEKDAQEITGDPDAMKGYYSEKANVYFETDLARVKEYMAANYGVNKASIADLISGFFRYYSLDFDSDKYMISIKEGKTIFKSKDDEYMFSIEDPFDKHHNPGRTLIKDSLNGDLTKQKLLEAYLGTLKDHFLSF